jgi:hypothetical protein
MKQYKLIKKHNLLMFKYHIINNFTGEITSTNKNKILINNYLNYINNSYDVKRYKNKVFYIINE